MSLSLYLLRRRIVFSGHLIFQNSSIRADLLDGGKTQGCLIYALNDLIKKDYYIELTACKSNHHNDSYLGVYCHFNGYCVDLWPLVDKTPGKYMLQDTHPFRQFLVDCSKLKNLFQIGLGGCADNAGDRIAAGQTEFPDNGADHIHLGTKYV